MSVMRDYAKKDYSIPKHPKRGEGEVVGLLACILMGMVLGAMFGYGLLFT